MMHGAQEPSTAPRVPALENGLRLLLAIAAQRRELSFAAILRLLELPKASAWRMVQTLEQLGFLRRGPDSGLYGLGSSVLRLGFDYLSSLDVVQHGQPAIQRLRDDTGCSSHLAMLDGREVVYVARVGAAGEISTGVSVGTRLPAQRAGLGRALMMDMSEAQLCAVFPEERFSDTSPTTPATRAELWTLLQDDRRRGHVVAESFYQPGICSVAHPVRDGEGVIVAVASVMVPMPSLPGELKARLVDRVAVAAREIEAFLRPAA